MSDQIEFLWRQLPNLLWGFPASRPGGLALSILLSTGAIALGLVLATGLALVQHHRRALPRHLAIRILRLLGIVLLVLLFVYLRTSYFVGIRFSTFWSALATLTLYAAVYHPQRVAARIVWALRGIPLIVLLVLMFQYLGTGFFFGIRFSAFWSAFTTLTLYAAAYQADIVYGGIAAVPQQLRDDAQVLGASRFTVARTVTMPYCLRTMRPALTTQAVTIFKDSSVVVVLGVTDLTTNARIALGGNVNNAPFWVATYLLVGLLYWCVAFGIARFAERHIRRDARLVGRAYA